VESNCNCEKWRSMSADQLFLPPPGRFPTVGEGASSAPESAANVARCGLGTSASISGQGVIGSVGPV